MPVNLVPPVNPRERILTYGGPGTGKSHGILTIARRCPSSHFYVLDTDFGSYERLLAVGEHVGLHVEDGGNVEPINADGWKDFTRNIAKWSDEAAREDWLVIDMMASSWDAVQGWFVEQIHGDDIDEYFLQVRMAKKAANDDKKALGAFDGWMDWPVINKTYFKFYKTILNFPGHVYLATETAKIEDGDEKATKVLYGGYGVKPKGQKRLGHVPSTVLLMEKGRTGDYSMTTVKDRGRVEVEDQEVGNFALDYLMKVAGWKVKVT